MTIGGALLLGGSALVMFMYFSAAAIRALGGEAAVPSWMSPGRPKEREAPIVRAIAVAIGVGLAALSQAIVATSLAQSSPIDALSAWLVLAGELLAALAWIAWLSARWIKSRARKDD